MRYDLHIFLHADTSRAKLSSLSRVWGNQTLGNWFAVNAEKFEKKLSEGVFAVFWDEADREWINEKIRESSIESKRVDCLATCLYPDPENAALSLDLILDPMISPILSSGDLDVLGENKLLKAEKMLQKYYPPSSKFGVFSHPPSQRFLLERGILYVKIVGYEPIHKTTGTDEQIKEFHRFEKVDKMLKNTIETLDPYYAFITNDREMDYVPTFDASFFPPLEPWQYCWRMFVYGRELVAKLGRDYLLQTPAYYVKELKNGTIWIQPTDERYRDNTSVEPITLTEAERVKHRDAVKAHLQITTPFA